MSQKATLGQISHFIGMCEEGVYDREFVQALIEKRVMIKVEVPDWACTDDDPIVASGNGNNRISVPDLGSRELIALARKSLGSIGSVDIENSLALKDFVLDLDRGRIFEVEVWVPELSVVPDLDVRKYYACNFWGNTAAFVAWVIKYKPEGYWASISSQEPLSPVFINEGNGRCFLDMFDGTTMWDSNWSFVAFRSPKKA